jgi:PUA-domain protein
MKRARIKAKELNRELANGGYDLEYSKKDSVEIGVDKEKELKVVLVNQGLCFFYYEDKLLPSLKLLQNKPELLKKVVVDMGAVKFVVNGADIMRPGIVEIDSGFEKDDFIVVVDVNNKKALSVGQAMFSSEDMQQMGSGKVVKNIHYVGDEIWNLN